MQNYLLTNMSWLTCSSLQSRRTQTRFELLSVLIMQLLSEIDVVAYAMNDLTCSVLFNSRTISLILGLSSPPRILVQSQYISLLVGNLLRVMYTLVLPAAFSSNCLCPVNIETYSYRIIMCEDKI